MSGRIATRSAGMEMPRTKAHPEVSTQICRICHNACPILVDIENGRAGRVRGDRKSPLHRGYLCPKGMSLPALHNGPRRLLDPLKRGNDGQLAPVRLE